MRRLVVGLAIGLAAGLAPTRAFADKQQDQQIAGHIFEKLTEQKEQGHLRGFDVRMRVINGTVWLTGHTASDAQRKLVLEIASHTKHLGTQRVINGVKVRNAGSSQPTVAAKPTALPVTADPKSIAKQDEPKPTKKPSTRPSLFASLGVSLSNPLRQSSADESNGTKRQAAYALATEEKKKTQHSSRRVVGRTGSTFKRQAMYRHPQSDIVRPATQMAVRQPTTAKADPPSSRRGTTAAPTTVAPSTVAQSAANETAAPKVDKNVAAQSKPAATPHQRPRAIAQPQPKVIGQPLPQQKVIEQPQPNVVAQPQPRAIAQPQPKVNAQLQPSVLVNPQFHENVYPQGTGVAPRVRSQSQPGSVTGRQPKTAEVTDLPIPRVAVRPQPVDSGVLPNSAEQPMQLPPHVVQQLMAQQYMAQQYLAQQLMVQRLLAQRQQYQTPLAFAPAMGASYSQPRPLANGHGASPMPAHLPGSGTAVIPTQHDNPSMPGYAWPSYASHPNYAGVTYPKQYSPMAWPFIGPYYPYPQVPMAWRRVTLEWKDGWWWLDFKSR